MHKSLSLAIFLQESSHVNPVHFTFVTQSAKTCLREEQTVSSSISCFHTFVIVYMVKTAQGATKMFPINIYERQKVPALTSDQSRDFLSLHKAGFLRLRNIYTNAPSLKS